MRKPLGNAKGFFLALKFGKRLNMVLPKPELRQSNSGKFRQDINALRAWAVLAVVCYHFGILGFSGGFAGVDIFFVISGYLMTGIIVSGLEAKKFSIFDFYFSRIKRIVPALIFLCIVLLVVGWFLLAPDDYATLAKHVKDSLLFTSNDTYRRESGYFDVLSHEKWLLHTWSLSIEWQFYIVLPIVLCLSWLVNKKRSWLFWIVLILFLYSLVSCIYKTDEAPTKAFYQIKYRYWEMLAGGLVFFLADFYKRKEIKIIDHLVYWLSVGCIFLPVFVISSEYSWPGYWALIPVLGAAGFIYSGRTDGVMVNNRLVNWLGDRSYSIYLWHWPAVVLLDYFQLLGDTRYLALGVVLSLLAAETSYRLIESRLRGVGRRDDWRLPLIIAGVGLSVCFLAWMIIKHQGLPARVDPVVVKMADEKNNAERNQRDCVYGTVRARGALSCVHGSGDLKAIVLGDSHAAAIATAVTAALPDQQGTVLLWSRAACPFIKGVTAKVDQDCNGFVNWVLEQLSDIPQDIPVILVQRSSLYPMGANEGVTGTGKVKPPVFFDKQPSYPSPEFLQQFRERSLDTLCEVARSRKLYWLRPVPELKVAVPQAMARAKMRGVSTRVEVTRDEYDVRHAFISSLMDQANEVCGVGILDPLPYLCDSRACYGDKEGWPIYFDDDHLSESGNKVLVPLFRSIFQEALKNDLR